MPSLAPTVKGAAEELGSRPTARGPRPGPGWRQAAWAGFASSRGPAGDAPIPAKKRPRSEPTSAPACERGLRTSVAAARPQGRPEPAFPRSESASAGQGPRPAPPFAIESPRSCGREPGVVEPGGWRGGAGTRVRAPGREVSGRAQNLRNPWPLALALRSLAPQDPLSAAAAPPPSQLLNFSISKN